MSFSIYLHTYCATCQTKRRFTRRSQRRMFGCDVCGGIMRYTGKDTYEWHPHVAKGEK